MPYFFASQLDVTDRVDAHLKVEQEKAHFEARGGQAHPGPDGQSLATKTMLVHEVDHRVKNNLQMIAALLAMQTKAITDPAARAAMEMMLTRVEALGIVHRRLYQSNDVERFDVAEFARDLVTDLVRGSGRDDIRLHLDLEAVEVPVSKAPPVALMMNELSPTRSSTPSPAIGPAGSRSRSHRTASTSPSRSPTTASACPWR